VLCGALLLGCTDSSDSAGRDRAGPEGTTATRPEATTSTAVVAGACRVETLLDASTRQHPDATIIDEACSAQFALATIEASSVDGGAGVALFVADGSGGWSLADVYAFESVAGELPELVPQAVLQGWDRRRQLRLDPPPPPTPTTEDPPATAPGGE
jgi:hypothetical protein